MIIGHDQLRSRLEGDLPQVTLLRGPDSVGKWTLAEHLSRHHGILPADLRAVPKLTMDQARGLQQFFATAPFGKMKMAILRLNSATMDSQNALLKLLEEPPPTASFILTASRPVLPTILSRSRVAWMGLLSDYQLTQILVKRFGMKEDRAELSALAANGQVKRALSEEYTDAARGTTLSLLKSVADKDNDLLTQALKGMDHETADSVRRLLECWLREAFTGEWRVFSPSDSFGLERDPLIPRKMLVLLSSKSEVRSKLALRVALEPLTVR